jgi:type II secretory ATPase GspE/PulE/Tfp pilus assembly ATPase PilB-like protein
MTCEEVRDELIAYARGELSAARKGAVEEHLVRCEGCARELDGARKVMALTQLSDTASIQDLAQAVIVAALSRRASDIHLERLDHEPRLRFRIDGLLHVQQEPVITPAQYEPLIGRFKLLAGQNLTEKRVPQDGRFRFTHAGKEHDLRVSTFPYFNGESIVMRLLDRSNVLIGMDAVGLNPQARAPIEAMLARPEGLVVCTGPTGAGKSTMLYSMLTKLNDPAKMMMSIEDPVEYDLRGVNQGQVNRRAGLTFATAMRAFMRQDPDLIMVSELRDLESAEMIAQAALTGHLVLTALHTPDATSALTRLLDIGLAPFIVAATLTGVVGQRLVRKVCPACREPYQPEENQVRVLGFTPETRPAVFTHGAGCTHCAGTGYQGRTGLHEVLTVHPVLAQMLSERAPEASIRTRALELNALWPFAADARAKIAEGITTAEEIDRVLPGLFAESRG